MFFYVLREFLEMTLIHLALSPQTPDVSGKTHDNARTWPSGRIGLSGKVKPALPLLRRRSKLQLPVFSSSTLFIYSCRKKKTVVTLPKWEGLNRPPFPF